MTFTLQRVVFWSCASPESHTVSKWRHKYLSRLRFRRSSGRHLLALSWPEVEDIRTEQGVEVLKPAAAKAP
jgi:hypothetical protein